MSETITDPDDLLTKRPTTPPVFTIKPPQPALSPAMRGVLETIIAPGESGGDYNVIYGGQKVSDLSQHPNQHIPITSGPNVGKTSSAAGKYQFIKSTWDQAANALGLTDFRKESQDKAAAWLAKRTYKEQTGRDIETDYASGDPALRTQIRHALAGQWESLGKASGPIKDKQWSLGNDRFRFSDDAMSAYDGQDDTDLVYMHPDDYLALSPSMEHDTAFSTKGWGDLRKSLAAGEPLKNLPTLATLDGKVTGQDGRSRALLAKMSGLDLLPVAMKGGAGAQQLEGMSGATVPATNFVPAKQMQTEKGADGSLIGRMLGIGSAQAAEPKNFWEQGSTPVETAKPVGNFWEQGSTPVTSGQNERAPSFPQDDPAYEYGSVLPFAKNVETGKVSLAAPELIRAPARGLVDLTQRLKGPLKPSDLRGLGPDEQAAFLAMGGVRPALGTAPKAASTLRPMAQEAHDAGYVLPPAMMKTDPGLTSKTLSGMSGKYQTWQAASEKNQGVTNKLAARSVGLPEDTPLIGDIYETVRAREGKTYREVENAVPEVDLSTKAFRDATSKIGGRNSEVEEFFPESGENPGIIKLRDQIKQNTAAPTHVVMKKIADLRRDANINLKSVGNAQAHRMGIAEREAADVMEDALDASVKNAPEWFAKKLDAATRQRDLIRAEREELGLPVDDPVSIAAQRDVQNWLTKLNDSLAADGSHQTLLDRFRQARKTMAKSYDLEGATNLATGDVSAPGLARLLSKRPLSGELKTIADTAKSFPKAMQSPAGFGYGEDWSALDFFGGAIAAAHGHPGVIGAIAARPLARATVLSSPWQNSMMAPRLPNSVGPRVAPWLDQSLPQSPAAPYTEQR